MEEDLGKKDKKEIMSFCFWKKKLIWLVFFFRDLFFTGIWFLFWENKI